MESEMAQVDVVFVGYADERVASTVTCIRDGEAIIIVDPGMVPSQSSILAPLADLGVKPEDVTDVILSHHHPDHTMNVALFPRARVHDTWAIYDGDVWVDRVADGSSVSPNVRLMATPGHTSEDLTTLVTTDAGVVALTHLWWDVSSENDPLAEDHDLLDANRRKVLELAYLIVPAHGAPFASAARL
jgi:glyoxylase-like metal-dependent hydrolase (beta-lactamase superfamily II)